MKQKPQPWPQENRLNHKPQDTNQGVRSGEGQEKSFNHYGHATKDRQRGSRFVFEGLVEILEFSTKEMKVRIESLHMVEWFA